MIPMTGRGSCFKPLFGAALMLLGGTALAGPPSGPDYSQLARTLSEDFPQSRARRTTPSATDFVPDPSIYSQFRSPTDNRVRQTGRVLRIERDHILVQLKPDAKPAEIRTLLEENRLRIAGGVPAIGCRGEDGPEEIAAAGGGIELVPARAPRALAETIHALLVDSDRLTRMGRQARETVQREFTWERCGHQTVAAYGDVLDG